MIKTLKSKNFYNKVYNTKLFKITNFMQYQFDSWLNGNFEDDPLPYEIRYMLFLLTNQSGSFSLCFSGGECLYDINQPLEYYPLEAENFSSSEFYNLWKNYYCYNVSICQFKYKATQKHNYKLRETFYLRLSISLIKNYLKFNRNSYISKKEILIGNMFKNANMCIKIQ